MSNTSYIFKRLHPQRLENKKLCIKQSKYVSLHSNINKIDKMTFNKIDKLTKPRLIPRNKMTFNKSTTTTKHQSPKFGSWLQILNRPIEIFHTSKYKLHFLNAFIHEDWKTRNYALNNPNTFHYIQISTKLTKWHSTKLTN